MEIQNLEINILYFMCNPVRGHQEDGTILERDLFEEFSDIPEEKLFSTIDDMVDDRLIVMQPSESKLSITDRGIDRLQSSIACRVHRFDACRCGRPK